jgi:hypothetical protein
MLIAGPGPLSHPTPGYQLAEFQQRQRFIMCY